MTAERPSGLVIHAVGRRALLAEVADTNAARRLYLAIRELPESDAVASPQEVVPGARTVLLDGIDDLTKWRQLLAACHLAGDSSDALPVRGTEVVIPVRYDGPDLDEVARGWACSVDELVRRHTHALFTVAFCGFAPGFAYCTSNLDLPPVPRRRDPRTEVPPGSVALAGGYCGIYPRRMPGGWQLIGTTDLAMFDPQRDPAALLQPGDRVRFEAVQ